MNEHASRDRTEVDVLVVGSVNEDRFAFVERFPRPGETVAARAARRGLGGKGANQCVAAAYAGARVRFLAKVGDDIAGADAVASLRSAGVLTETVAREPGALTGTAAITVDAGGENCIVVDAGANARLAATDVDRLFDDGGLARVVLVQGEVPTETIVRAAANAAATAARFVLNLAPVVAVPDEVLALADPLVVNEHEAAEILGQGAATIPTGALLDGLSTVARSVVITLGAAGAVASRDGETWTTPSIPARTVADTTGAGDAFVGSLCARLSLGEDLAGAMTWASAAASLSVERPGSAESYAAGPEVERHLAAAGVRA